MALFEHLGYAYAHENSQATQIQSVFPGFRGTPDGTRRITMTQLSVDGLVENILLNLNDELAQEFSGDVLFLKSGMMQPIDDLLRIEVEAINNGNKKGDSKDKLVVLLETTGGYIEVVERIVKIFRNHYQEVEFVVPNYAYSAGTVLVMSGDEIHMDYHSILGPIDPQFETDGDAIVPGMGYLAKYEELVKTINDTGDVNGVKAELAYLVQRFDPAKLYHIEQAIEHSIALLKEWLPIYKFKDWTVTSRGMKVTKEMKEQRAHEIAEILGKSDRWHSHGRGISLVELTDEEIKLKVENFGLKPKLSKKIRTYYSLLIDYMYKTSMNGAIHTQNGLRRTR
ncbi:MAG: hypothetical protein RQ899_10740 [Pseudomonadales bacterium]|nr:hypothetical protein [Pseudomonadales bacterium]